MTKQVQDPNEIARKLQKKLASLNSTDITSGSLKIKRCDHSFDNVSLCSSASFHSANDDVFSQDASIKNDQHILVDTTLTDSKGTAFKCRNSSIISLPYSLPTTLDYQVPLLQHNETVLYGDKTTTGGTRDIDSSLQSREDLQCNWTSESRKTSITMHDHDPLSLIQAGNVRRCLFSPDTLHRNIFQTVYFNAFLLKLKQRIC